MERRKLGDLKVSAIGLGCMSMTPIYGIPDADEAIATLHRAPDIGIDFIDTSDAYGANGSNEELVGHALKGRRERYVLATKFGNIRLPDGRPGAKGNPEYVMEACDKSLKRLGTDYIDLYFIHRVDDTVPIEDTVGAMARLKARGKIRNFRSGTHYPPPGPQSTSHSRAADRVFPVDARRGTRNPAPLS
jgi:aryl-alcohol dehydrogenase-like predicted oxidoreductase